MDVSGAGGSLTDTRANRAVPLTFFATFGTELAGTPSAAIHRPVRFKIRFHRYALLGVEPLVARILRHR
jgi:hypothetical protein